MNFFPNHTSVQLSSDENGIAHLQMIDVAGKNGLTPHFVEELIACINEVKFNESFKVVVMSGTAEIFNSGADLKTLERLSNKEMKPVDIILTKMMLDIPVPIIAAAEGHAIGGGLALAVCADMLIIAEESRYGCSFMNMGFTPGMGITKLMERFMSPAIAQEMQFTGIFYQGRSLKGKTNFNYILPKAEVLDKAMELAEAISTKPRKAIVTLKRYQSMERRKTFEETFSIETMMHELTFDQTEILKIIQENYVKY